MHAASEVTGNQEAHGFHLAFLTPPKYGLVPDTPAFAYVATHVEREKDHSADTVVVLDEVLSLRPEDADEIVQGSRDYMALYLRMFTQMRERIFVDA